MKKRTWVIGGVAALVLGMSMLLISRFDKARDTIAALADRFTGLVQRPAVDPNLIEASGRLEAQEFDLAAKNGGRVIVIDTEEGDIVAEGDTVAKLDKLELEALLRRAEAELLRAQETLNQAKAVVTQRESDVKLADAELRRAVMIPGRNLVVGDEYDHKKAEHDSAEAALLLAMAQQRAADAGVAAGQAEIDRIRVNLTDMQITSPREGRVLYKLVELGAVVSPGQRLLTLLDLTDVYVTVFLPMEQAGRLTIGHEATVTLDAWPERPMEGRVVFISPRAQFTPKTVETKDERAKFMFRVKVRITDPRGVPLNPGLPAVARILLNGSSVSML